MKRESIHVTHRVVPSSDSESAACIDVDVVLNYPLNTPPARVLDLLETVTATAREQVCAKSDFEPSHG